MKPVWLLAIVAGAVYLLSKYSGVSGMGSKTVSTSRPERPITQDPLRIPTIGPGGIGSTSTTSFSGGSGGGGGGYSGTTGGSGSGRIGGGFGGALK